MRRIGLISHDFYPFQGGQGRNFYELFTRLRAGCPSYQFLAFSPCRNDLPGHCRLPANQAVFSLKINRFIVRLVEDHRLDAVIINGGPGGVLLGRRAPVPSVYWVNHTYWQQARLVPGQAWKLALVPFERFSYSRASRLVAISADTKQALVDRYRFPPPEIVLIPAGVDHERFQPSPAARCPRSILYVGRLHARKGVDFLLSAMPGVLAAVPDARLWIAGEGSLRGDLQKLAAELGVAASTEFLGRVSDEELPEWYRRCAVKVVP